jgi:hypothetical protein
MAAESHAIEPGRLGVLVGIAKVATAKGHSKFLAVGRD